MDGKRAAYRAILVNVYTRRAAEKARLRLMEAVSGEFFCDNCAKFTTAGSSSSLSEMSMGPFLELNPTQPIKSTTSTPSTHPTQSMQATGFLDPAHGN